MPRSQINIDIEESMVEDSSFAFNRFLNQVNDEDMSEFGIQIRELDEVFEKRNEETMVEMMSDEEYERYCLERETSDAYLAHS